jgi:hypothetical protein
MPVVNRPPCVTATCGGEIAKSNRVLYISRAPGEEGAPSGAATVTRAWNRVGLTRIERRSAAERGTPLVALSVCFARFCAEP